jgi:hypothetical protein
MYFYEETQRLGYWYTSPNPVSEHAIGTSLMYTREWWQSHKFREGQPNPNVQEDVKFVREACIENQLSSASAELLMVARIHPENTSIKNYSDPCQMEYRLIDAQRIPQGFFA